MIGKIIVHGDTREQALARMRTRCRRRWSKAS
jgi:biotin carboxylase